MALQKPPANPSAILKDTIEFYPQSKKQGELFKMIDNLATVGMTPKQVNNAKLGIQDLSLDFLEINFSKLQNKILEMRKHLFQALEKLQKGLDNNTKAKNGIIRDITLRLHTLEAGLAEKKLELDLRSINPSGKKFINK